MTDPFANPADLVRRVYAYVAYRIGPGPDAEDVTSATFERALRYRESYDRRKGEPIGWLVGIAQRCIADAVASRPQPAELVDAPDPTDLEGTTIERLDLGHAVSQLSQRDRELIALRYGADLKSRQIAELLEMNTNAVEVAHHRALDRLREVVEESPKAGMPPGRRPADGTTRTSQA
jgi:RNA polymerase sigma factor (sigma-70 family)